MSKAEYRRPKVFFTTSALIRRFLSESVACFFPYFAS